MAPTMVDTPMGKGIRNPNNPLSRISLDDERIVGYTPEGMPVYESKKPVSLQELAKEEGKKEIVKQGRDAIKDAVFGGAGLGGMVGGGGSSAGAPAVPQIVGANRIDAAGNVIASGAPAQSGWALEGIGSAGNYILPAAGAVTLGDLYLNRRENIGHGSGYLQGAAGGAMVGSYFGPWGAVAGAGIGLAANALGIGAKSRTKVEEDRRGRLSEAGITVPFSDVKEWESNEAFRQSRNEADLKGGDIENAAAFYEIQGYKDLDQALKEEIAQEAINKGLIREHHGTIDLSMTPEYQEYLKSKFPGESTGSGTNARAQAEAKKNRKRKIVSDMFPEINASVTQGPRYDTNPGNLINNPYL